MRPKRQTSDLRSFLRGLLTATGVILFLSFPFAMFALGKALYLAAQKNYLQFGYWRLFLELTTSRMTLGLLVGFLVAAPFYLSLRRLLQRTGDPTTLLVFLSVFICWWYLALYLASAAIPLDLGLGGSKVRSLFSILSIVLAPMAFQGAPSVRHGLVFVFPLLYLLINSLGYLLGVLAIRFTTGRFPHLRCGWRINLQRYKPAARPLARSGWIIMLFLLLLASVPLPSRTKPPGPNLILISIDTLRADHLGCYGYPRPVSPTLDAFAAEAIVFNDVFADSPWTLPSHATMLSGHGSLTHGAVLHNRGIAGDILLLSEILREAGYQTKALVSSIFLSPNYGFAAGFNEYHFWADNRRSDVLIDRAMRLVDERDDPFFLFLHLFDPHWPYDPPVDWLGKRRDEYKDVNRPAQFPEFLAWALQAGPDLQEKARRLYDEEISFTDAQLGRFFTYLHETGLWNQTVVAVTSDHGEELLDHGLWGHGHSLYQEQLRVPLIVHLPPRYALPPRRIAAPVGLIDLTPTLLDLLNVPAPVAMEGRSLVRLLRGDDAATGEECYLAHLRLSPPHAAEQFALRQGPYKYFSPAGDVPFGDYTLPHPEQLFDLAADPGEQTDLSQDRPEDLLLLRESLNELLGRRLDRGGSEVPISPETLRRLRSLGYLQ